MSIKCSQFVWDHSEASGNDRLVMLAIADEADDEGRNAFPSIRRIARKVRCHTETVSECIKRLEDAGELEVNRPERQGRGRFNRYRVLMERAVISDPSENGVSSTGSVTGLARIRPAPKEEQSAPKQTSIRALNHGAQGSPQEQRPFRLGSVPEPRPWCDECEGTGWTMNDADEAVECRTCVA